MALAGSDTAVRGKNPSYSAASGSSKLGEKEILAQTKENFCL